MPAPSAPASMNSARFAAPTPPVTTMRAEAGRTARIALMNFGAMASPGKIFRQSAPASSAAKASDGVNTPGQEIIPSRLVARTTSALKFGETTIRPPASAVRCTCSGVSTVPAPIRQVSPWASASWRMVS